MDIVIAVAHYLGAVFAVIVLLVLSLAFDAWIALKDEKSLTDELSLAVGHPVDNATLDRDFADYAKILGERYSAELFRNRISDLAGIIWQAWNWLGLLLQIGALGLALWLTATSGSEAAVSAWLVPIVTILIWAVAIMFAMLCKLLTGRYPGQAKRARQNLAELLAKASELRPA
ncbi:MAG: hypothetical protein QNJ00_05975 [Woeseiaceae bacterium]|nr:hypothetical protein [Woeseiaceae bacterium]